MKERKGMLDKSSSLSIRHQYRLLSLCRSSVYVETKGERGVNLDIMRMMDEHHLDHPTKGVLQMQDYLKSEGHWVNEKRVRRYYPTV